MTTFSIHSDNNFTAHSTAKEAGALGDGTLTFTTERELAKATGDWPLSRFADAWNAFAGAVPFDALKPVRKFTDRKTAVARIWTAIQRLVPNSTEQEADGAPMNRRRGRSQPKPTLAASTREGTKKAKVLALLGRKQGATLVQIMNATGWQAHSIRGFLSGALSKKMGLKIESVKRDASERIYRLAK